MTPCKFSFDDGTIYDGFTDGTTWNGFDNVSVTAATLAKIKDDLGAEEFEEVSMGDDGLYSLAHGFCTCIEE